MSKNKVIIIVAIVVILLLIIVGVIIGNKVTTPPQYKITIAPTENCSLIVSVADKEVDKAKEGETVTITLTPDKSFVIEEVYYILDDSQKRVDIHPTESIYSFQMPAQSITVYVKYKALYNIQKITEGEGSFVVNVNGQEVGQTFADTIVTVLPTAEQNNQITNIYYVVQGTDTPVPIFLTEGEFSFVMPSQHITIHVEFAVTTEGVGYLYDASLHGYVVTGYNGAQPNVIISAVYDDNTNGLHSVVGIVNNKLFASCFATTVQSVRLPYTISNIDDYSFYNCINLSNIDLQCVQSIGDYALTNTQITAIKLSNVNSIGSHAFYRCTKLTDVILGDNLTQLPDYAFGSCSALVNINLNNVSIVGSNVFENSILLTNLDMSNVTTLGNAVFTGCYSLTTINLPKITTIGYATFYACTSLSNLTLGVTLSEIYQDTFALCTALTSITYQGSMAQWQSIVATPADIGLDYAQTSVKCQDGTLRN